MKDYYVFEYSNTSIFNTKSYELLKSSVIASGETTAIITNSKQDSDNLDRLIKTAIKKKEIKVNCFALTEFIDSHYNYNISKQITNLDTYFKLYLSNSNNLDLHSLLYCSTTLRKDFLTSYLKKNVETLTQLELELNASSTIKTQCIDLSKKFDIYLKDNFNFNSNDFYTSVINPPNITKLKHLFFINPILSCNSQKKHLSNLANLYESGTWIVNKSNIDCISWLKSSIKNKQFISENQNKLNNYKINQHSTLQNEINTCIDTIKTNLDNTSSQISIIIPNNHTYKEILELKLNQQNIDFNLYFSTKKTVCTLKHFFISIIQFLSKEFNLNTLYSLSSNPLCKQINIKINQEKKEILFDIHTLKLIEQKHIEELNNHHKKTQLEYLLEFIKSRELLHPDKINSLNTLCETQKKFHNNLSNPINSEKWFLEFQNFLNQFKDFNLNLTSKTHIKHDIKKIIEIIGTTLSMITNSQPEKLNKDIIFDLLIEKINNYNPKNTDYKTTVGVYLIEQARYIKHNICYLLGFSNSLYKLPTSSSVFDSIFYKNKLNISLKTACYQSEILDDLHHLCNTLNISMANSINDEIQLPSLHENTTLKKVMPQQNTQKAQITNSFTEVGKTIIPTINIPNLSATQLDLYNQCPYKYWIEHVVKLDNLSSESNEISAAQWGIFIHNILNEFNTWILKNQNTTKKTALDKIKEITKNKFLELKTPNLFWVTKYNTLQNKTKTPSVLETIVDIYFSSDLLTTLAKTEQKYTKTINQTTIKGTIDAIFQTPFGPIVVDYKTGKSLASSKDIELLRSLQIPIYFFCLYNKKSNLAQAAIYFQINSQEKTGIHLKACTKEIKTEYLKKSKQRPFIYDESFFKKIETKINILNTLIKNSYFSPDYKEELHETYKTRQKTCQFCSYKIACRYKKRMIV